MEVPDWPKPPTEADCQRFESEIESFYQEIMEKRFECARNHNCTNEPGLYGTALVRRVQVPDCYRAAQRKDVVDATIDFLRSQRKTDAAVADVGELSARVRDVKSELDGLRQLKDNVASFSKLSDKEKLSTVNKMAQFLNKNSANLALSKQLTEDVLNKVTDIHADVLASLDLKLKNIADFHATLVGAERARRTVDNRIRQARVKATERAAEQRQELADRLSEAKSAVQQARNSPPVYPRASEPEPRYRSNDDTGAGSGLASRFCPRGVLEVQACVYEKRGCDAGSIERCWAICGLSDYVWGGKGC
jgi:hypothetical protein